MTELPRPGDRNGGTTAGGHDELRGPLRELVRGGELHAHHREQALRPAAATVVEHDVAAAELGAASVHVRKTPREHALYRQSLEAPAGQRPAEKILEGAHLFGGDLRSPVRHRDVFRS